MPRIGLRIIKTSIAVFIIMVLFTLFGVQRSPFYVLITTIICIQPDKENEKNQALVRALGTLYRGNYRSYCHVFTAFHPY